MENKELKYIVGIGASAGGLEALSELLNNLSKDKLQITFIVAQHLSPHYKSMLVQLLGRETSLPVLEAQNGLELMAQHIYIAPPDSEIQIMEGKIHLSRPSSAVRPKPSVDLLFSSLAHAYKKQAIGIILSGTGSDGSQGIKAIRANGGYTFAQDPKTAKYDGMPHAAIHIGQADFVLSTQKIAEKINELALYDIDLRKELSIDEEENTETTISDLEKVFELLSIRTGTNFANYKPSTICRRLEKRMQEVAIGSLEEYLVYVKKNPKEVDELFNTILIGVTTFFRDIEAFIELEKHLRQSIAAKKKGESIRIWVAGCATGEEAYTMAIMVYQLLNGQLKDFQIQIFATDIDTEAISFARKGIYHKNALENINESVLEQFFIQKDENHYELVKTIRNMVLFSKHDLTNNPPFVRLDLISCRNLLIYFGAALQKQIFPIFHYALSQKAYLFLGKSESVGQFTDLFDIVDAKYKLFQRKMGTTLNYVRFTNFKLSQQHTNEPSTTLKDFSVQDALKDTFYEAFDYPYVVVNENMDIVESRGDLRQFLNFPQGKAQLNLAKLVHQSLQLPLRSLFNKALHAKETVKIPIRKYLIFEKEYFLRFRIKPVFSFSENLFVVIFENYELEEEFVQLLGISEKDEPNSPRLLELEHELAATKEHLQTYIEEIETSNEELQALNEELQSANEELQSSNEELETANEELQSSNEELQIAYGELKSVNETLERKDSYISKINSNFEALLAHTQQGFLLVEKNYEVQLFNTKTYDTIFNLTGHQISKKSSILDAIPIEKMQVFVANFRIALEGKTIESELEVSNIDQQRHWLNFSFSPVWSSPMTINEVAISITDITEKKNNALEVFKQKEFFKSLLNSDSAYLIRTDMLGNYTYVNDAFCKKFGLDRKQLIGKYYAPTVHPNDLDKCEKAIEELFQNPEKIVTSQIRKPNPEGGYFDTEWQFVAIYNPEGEIVEVQCVGFDISEHKIAIKKLEEERKLLEVMIKGGKFGTWIWNVKTGEVSFNDEWAAILGYQTDQITQFEQWKNLIHTNDKDLVLGVLEDVVNQKSDYYDVEHRKLSKDGTWKWLFLTGKVFEKDQNGSVLKLIGVHQDITARKNAEEAKRVLEERTQNIFDTMQEGIVIQDMNGSIISCNESAERILGMSHDQMIGKTSLDPSWRAIREDGSDFLGQDHPVVVTIRTQKPQWNVIMGVHKPDNTITWISINSQLLSNPETKQAYAAFATFYEITDIKNAEAQINTEKRRLKNILEGTNVGTWEWNVQTGETIFNERWADIIGYTLAELQPINIDTWLKFANPEDLERSAKALQEHFDGQNPFYDCEARMKHKNGHWVWVWDRGKVVSWTEDGKPLWISGTHQDITHKKEQEQRIKDSEILFRASIEASLEGIFLLEAKMDSQNQILDFIVKEVNENACKQLSMNRQQIIGFGICELFPVNLENGYFDIYKNIFETQSHFEQEYHIPENYPASGWYYHQIIAIPRGIVIYNKDISGRKKQEQALQESQRRLDLLASNFPDGSISLIDRNLNFLYTGGAGYKEYAVSPKEWVGKPIKNFLPAPIYQKIEENLTAIWEGKTHSIEVEFEAMTFLNTFQPVLNQAGEVESFVLVAIDISKRKAQELLIYQQNENLAAAEEELKTNLEELKELYDKIYLSQVKIKAISDSTTDSNILISPDLHILFFNRQAAFISDKFFGKSMSEGDSILDFIATDEHENFKANFQKALQGEQVALEKQISLNKYVKRWFEVKYFPVYDQEKNMIGISHTYTDIQVRKENEEAIIKAHQRLLQLEKFVDLSTDAIQVADQTGRLVYINETASKRLGIKKAEAHLYFVRDFEKVFETEQHWQEHLTDLKENPEGVTLEGINIDHTTQSTFPVEVKANYLEIGKNAYVVAVSRDITERKKQEAELKKLAIVAQKTIDMVVVTNPKGEIEWVNDTFEKITEWKFEEVIGKRPSQLLQGEETDLQTIAYMREKIQNQQSFEAEVINYTKSGRKYWISIRVNPIFDENGNLLYFIALESDVTSQKRVYQKLLSAYQESRNFRNALERSSAVVVLNPRQSILAANSAFCEIYGYQRSEILGKNISLIAFSENEFYQEIWQTVTSGKSWYGELKTLTKKKDLVWLRCFVNPILNTQQEVYQYLMVAFDMTEQRNMEIAYKNQQEEHQLFLEEKVTLRTQELFEEKQKLEVANKRIRSSIFYAKRIQNVILPTETDFKKHFKDYFVYNLPKDIVSGDFYWLGQHNNQIVFAVVDCTGHGVPGAFMSMLAYSSLNEIVHREGILSATQILEKLDKIVRFALKQDESQVQDGMDMALCIIDKENKKLTFSGAKNPLVYVENRQLYKLEASRRHIGGKIGRVHDSFHEKTIELTENQVFYMFSDGYADQFGSTHKQKFSRKRFEDLLHEIHHHPMLFQQDILDQNFISWMSGFGLRLDDVLVIGFRIF